MTLKKKLCDKIAQGHFLHTAAISCNISEGQVIGWLSDSDFTKAVNKAEGQAQRKLMDVIIEAAMGGDWSAAAWLLEQGWPDRFCTNRQAKIGS